MASTRVERRSPRSGRARPWHLARSLASSAFVPAWTAFMVSAAAAGTALTRDRELFRRQQRVWALGVLRFSGIRVAAFGTEHIDPGLPCVMVANHQSYMDVPVLFTSLPIIPGFVAKRELTRVPFLAAALRLGGHVVIDRGGGPAAARSLKAAADEVRGGKAVLVFPEGTRGHGKRLGRFRSGAFRLARLAGVPLLPIGIRGSARILPKHRRLIRPGRVEVHVGTPLPPASSEGDVRRQAADVRTGVARLAGVPPNDDPHA